MIIYGHLVLYTNTLHVCRICGIYVMYFYLFFANIYIYRKSNYIPFIGLCMSYFCYVFQWYNYYKLYNIISSCNSLCGPILPCVQTMGKEGPGPISSVRANENPRTASRGMDKITIRGEVEHVCEELGRVRGRWLPRDFCPRYLVNSLITQNNAWDKSYNRAKGEISNKK